MSEISEPSRQTFRMLKRGGDLDHYVFTDEAHARQWLAQPIVDRENIKIEPVEVGPFKQCTKCKGEGFHRTIRATGPRITANEFLFKGNGSGQS